MAGTPLTSRAKTSPVFGRRVDSAPFNVRSRSAEPSSPRNTAGNFFGGFLQVPGEIMQRPRSNSSPNGDSTVHDGSSGSNTPDDQEIRVPSRAINVTKSDEALHRYSSHFLDGRHLIDGISKNNFSKMDVRVNNTSHPERRQSKFVIHPSQGSTESFTNNLGAVVDEVLDYSRTNQRRNLELEHSSGGLLTASSPETASKMLRNREQLLFSDGKRRIDFVLVYQDEDFGVITEAECLRREKRKVFQQNLELEGLELEVEDKKFSFDEMTTFVKIHAPWPVITRYAELMNLKMPIKLLKNFGSGERFKFQIDENSAGRRQYDIYTIGEDDEETEDRVDSKGKQSWLDWFMDIFEYDHNRIPPEPSFYKATFSRHLEEQFVVKDRETFFTSAQRSQIVWQILMRAKNDESERVGIRRLLNEKTYLAAFPLHEGRWDEDPPNGICLDRRLLYLVWCNFCCVASKTTCIVTFLQKFLFLKFPATTKSYP